MTNTTTIVDRGVRGDLKYVVAQVDITSLTNAGNEPYDADSKFNMDVLGASVVAKGDGSYNFGWDDVNNAIYAYSGGTGATAATAVGTVTLEFVGR